MHKIEELITKHLPLAVICIVCMWITTCEGYSQTADATHRQTKTIIDMSGKAVAIPRLIDRIVVTCYGGASQEVSVLGGTDKIVAQPSMRRFPQLLKMYPRFVDMPDVGSFDSINVEQIMALKPDIAVASVYSTRGNKKIESTGIKVVAVSTGLADINRLLEEFMIMGKMIGEEKRAGQLVQYWNDRLSLLLKRTAAIPGSKRKRYFIHLRGRSYALKERCGGGTILSQQPVGPTYQQTSASAEKSLRSNF